MRTSPAGPSRHDGVVVTEFDARPFGQRISVGGHDLAADEPAAIGGADSGPTPYDLLLAGLGACTSITVRMYAERKGWPLRLVTVRLRHQRIHAIDCVGCETQTGRLDHIERELQFDGELTGEQRARLLDIADRCPVHRTLHSRCWYRRPRAGTRSATPVVAGARGPGPPRGHRSDGGWLGGALVRSRLTAREPASQRARPQTDRESYALACEALASFDLRNRVAARKVPLLVAAGQHDPVVPPEQARSVAPDAFAVIPGCGHLPPAEDPAAVADLLASFFKSAKDGVDPAAGRLA